MLQKIKHIIILKNHQRMNLVVASGDIESYVVIMNKIDYQNKLNGEINYGLHKIIYKEEEDNSYIAGSKSTTIMEKC